MSGGPARAAIDEARDLLVELVEIASPSGSEGRIVKRIEAWCAERDLPSHRVSSETGRDSLVVGSLEPELAIAAHVDTISPTWGASATVDGDVVRGLGALDDKGGVVACLLAARDLVEAGEDLGRLGVAFAFPVDEERGGSGSRTLALALQPAYAIALEGTGLRPGIAECGDIDAWVHVAGKSAHGALSELGQNAIHGAAALIAALPQLELGRFTHDLIGDSQAEVGAIRGGTEFNTVPDRCSFQLQVRLVPGQDGGQTLAAVEALAAEHDAYVELVEATDPFETDPGSPIVRELVAATETVVGAAPEPHGVPAWTDAHNFVDFAGAEAVVFGPGDFATAHTPEEHLDAGEAARCAEVFVQLARKGWRR